MTRKARPWACSVLPLLIGRGYLQLLDPGSPSQLLLKCEKESGHDQSGLHRTPDGSLAPLVLRCLLTLDNANRQRADLNREQKGCFYQVKRQTEKAKGYHCSLSSLSSKTPVIQSF